MAALMLKAPTVQGTCRKAQIYIKNIKIQNKLQIVRGGGAVVFQLGGAGGVKILLDQRHGGSPDAPFNSA